VNSDTCYISIIQLKQVTSDANYYISVSFRCRWVTLASQFPPTSALIVSWDI